MVGKGGGQSSESFRGAWDALVGNEVREPGTRICTSKQRWQEYYPRVHEGGDFLVSSGADISTTVFASVIALLNDGLISQGKPVMGFLNPFLYSVAPEVSILNDITMGFVPTCSSEGLDTTPGWDPITGLGTPNFPSFKAFVESNA